MAFPATRLRRLRKTGVLRDLVRETRLSPSDLVYPMFVQLGEGRTPVEAMPGVERMSISHAVEEAGEVHGLGIPAVLLFGLPAEKDEQASGAYDDEGVVQLAVRAIKEAHPELVTITDVCLCAYTSHGHCGVVLEDGSVDNDLTLELLAKTAISHARAGADAVAPSDMMDGRVGALRSQLDAEGHKDLPIVAYSAKFASAFYGPFREAADSAPAFGDRRSYQMDPANSDEAVREALLDVEEGADVVMVKPALPYLDVIRRVKEATNVPVAAYNVSGEYAMVKAAAAAGHIDERAIVLETLTAIRRAGADIVITYHAKDAARWLEPLAKVRSRRGGSAVPLDDADKRLLNLLQGSFPLGSAPVRSRRRAGGAVGGRGARPHPAAPGRAHHPGDHADLRHARARLQLDAGGREGGLREPLAGRQDHQLAPGRVPQLPARSRLQPLVHDRDRAGFAVGPRTAHSTCCSG